MSNMSQDRENDPTEITETLEQIPDEEDLIAPVKTFRRRMVIRYLSQLPEDAVLEIREVATSIAALENDIPIHKVAKSEYSRTYSGISERDAKKLSIIGVLERRGKSSIARGDKFEFYASMLDDLDEFLFSRK
jgi:hypothetical protein